MEQAWTNEIRNPRQKLQAEWKAENRHLGGRSNMQTKLSYASTCSLCQFGLYCPLAYLSKYKFRQELMLDFVNHGYRRGDPGMIETVLMKILMPCWCICFVFDLRFG